MASDDVNKRSRSPESALGGRFPSHANRTTEAFRVKRRRRVGEVILAGEGRIVEEGGVDIVLRSAPPGLGAAALWAREAASFKSTMGVGRASSSLSPAALITPAYPLPSTRKALAALVGRSLTSRPKYGNLLAKPEYWPKEVPWMKGKSASQMDKTCLQQVAAALLDHQASAGDNESSAMSASVLGCGQRTKKEMAAMIRTKFGTKRLHYGDIDRRPKLWPHDVPWDKGLPLSTMGHPQLSRVFGAIVGAGAPLAENPCEMGTPYFDTATHISSGGSSAVSAPTGGELGGGSSSSSSSSENFDRHDGNGHANCNVLYDDGDHYYTSDGSDGGVWSRGEGVYLDSAAAGNCPQKRVKHSGHFPTAALDDTVAVVLHNCNGGSSSNGGGGSINGNSDGTGGSGSGGVGGDELGEAVAVVHSSSVEGNAASTGSSLPRFPSLGSFVGLPMLPEEGVVTSSLSSSTAAVTDLLADADGRDPVYLEKPSVGGGGQTMLVSPTWTRAAGVTTGDVPIIDGYGAGLQDFEDPSRKSSVLEDFFVVADNV